MKITGIFLTLVILSLAQFMPSTAAAQNINCNSSFVQLNAGNLLVLPNGSNDTANIQCALDEANRLGLPAVRLQNQTYWIGYLEVENFEGTFQGTKRDQSIVNVIDGSIDCAQMMTDGKSPSVIKFINGIAKVAKMSIYADTPCQGGAFSNAYYVIHFTGRDAFSGCDQDTGHGVVDRVDMYGSEPNDNSSHRAVGAFAEGLYHGTCRRQQLGTIKVNRGTIQGFDIATVLGLRASAQVDVNFNTFSQNLRDVLVFNASQLLTVQANTFNSQSRSSSSYYGIITVTADNSAPETNKIAVQRNNFKLRNNPGGSKSVGVWAYQDNYMALLDVALNNNTFDMSGDDTEAGIFEDINGGRITGNLLFGNGKRGLFLTGQERTLAAWSVVNNDFLGLDTEILASPQGTLDHEDIRMDSDCVLDEDTFENIWGPSQAGWVEDMGSSNFVLESEPPPQAGTWLPGLDNYNADEQLQAKRKRVADEYIREYESVKDDITFRISAAPTGQ
jgi:hypothetical protein